MPLETMKTVLGRAQRGEYAVPAFNVCNSEYVNAVFTASSESKAPVIFAIHPVEIEHAGIETITAMIKAKAEQHPYPVVMHLDHGDSFERAAQCIRYGFTSVMYDGSELPFEDNVRNTHEIVRLAHAVGVSVEGELGVVGGTEGDSYAHGESFAEDQLTDPDTAHEFVMRTGIDSLAVAIGTAHGFYKGEPRIDLERLARIRDAVDIPLVLHGGSGIPEATIKETIRLGICKINISSEFKRAFHQGLVKRMGEVPDQWDPLEVFPAATTESIKLLKEKLQLFGAVDQAIATYEGAAVG